MHILHTESSNGWGGQEIRILKEALGLKERGYRVSLAVVRGGRLVDYARREGLDVFEIDFKRSSAFKAVWDLCRIIKKQKIDILNTHSSLDAWLGAIAAKMLGKKVIRTRHLSTNIRGGLNAKLLYNRFADFVVTTSSCIIPMIQEKAHLPSERIRCVPTGVTPFQVSEEERLKARETLGIKPNEILIGSVCVVRSWKGIQDLIAAAKMLRHDPRLKWVVVGGGYLENFKPLVDDNLPFVFTGHQNDPKPALAALDIFTLLSTAHEGISQASLQAAFLKKPLITTSIGGLPEVCLDGLTGLIVPPSSPVKVAEAVQKLSDNPSLREKMGRAAHHHVTQNYMFFQTLENMADVLAAVLPLKK